ncbi:MAG: hypothetical protein ABR874_23135, partial [Candidatus Sulfotelmatobacter sp.]
KSGPPLPRPAPKTYLDYRNPPTFKFYPQFVEDWEGFSAKEKSVVGEFLETLQAKYDDPELQREWEWNGTYWGAAVPEIGFRVFWQVVYPSHPSLPKASEPAEDIRILACERIPGDQEKKR